MYCMFNHMQNYSVKYHLLWKCIGFNIEHFNLINYNKKEIQIIDPVKISCTYIYGIVVFQELYEKELCQL